MIWLPAHLWPLTKIWKRIEHMDSDGLLAESSWLLEAAFGPGSAVCVAHTRLPDVLSLDAVKQRYP